MAHPFVSCYHKCNLTCCMSEVSGRMMFKRTANSSNKDASDLLPDSIRPAEDCKPGRPIAPDVEPSKRCSRQTQCEISDSFSSDEDSDEASANSSKLEEVILLGKSVIWNQETTALRRQTVQAIGQSLSTPSRQEEKASSTSADGKRLFIIGSKLPEDYQVRMEGDSELTSVTSNSLLEDESSHLHQVSAVVHSVPHVTTILCPQTPPEADHMIQNVGSSVTNTSSSALTQQGMTYQHQQQQQTTPTSATYPLTEHSEYEDEATKRRERETTTQTVVMDFPEEENAEPHSPLESLEGYLSKVTHGVHFFKGTQSPLSDADLTDGDSSFINSSIVSGDMSSKKRATISVSSFHPSRLNINAESTRLYSKTSLYPQPSDSLLPCTTTLQNTTSTSSLPPLPPLAKSTRENGMLANSRKPKKPRRSGKADLQRTRQKSHRYEQQGTAKNVCEQSKSSCGTKASAETPKDGVIAGSDSFLPEQSPKVKVEIESPGFERSEQWQGHAWEAYNADKLRDRSNSSTVPLLSQTSIERRETTPSSLQGHTKTSSSLERQRTTSSGKNVKATDLSYSKKMSNRSIMHRLSASFKRFRPGLCGRNSTSIRDLQGAVDNCQTTFGSSSSHSSRTMRRMVTSTTFRDGLMESLKADLNKTVPELQAENRLDILPWPEMVVALCVTDFLQQNRNPRIYEMTSRQQKKMILLANMCLIRAKRAHRTGVELTKGCESRFPQVKDILWIHTV